MRKSWKASVYADFRDFKKTQICVEFEFDHSLSHFYAKRRKIEYFGVWHSWGRFRAPLVADEARRKEWQQLGDWQVSCAHADRALVATGSARHFWDCEIGNSGKIPDTSKKPLILRFFRFHIF